MTCHNRRAETLRCLEKVYSQEGAAQNTIDVFLVDDGCSDGTADEVSRLYPDVCIISGDGTLYWSGGTRRAFEVAMRGRYDFYLWINDDTFLHAYALTTLLDTWADHHSRTNEDAVVIGTTVDARSGLPSYGGWVSKSKLFPTKLVKMGVIKNVAHCDTGNGNVVLIPAIVPKTIGNIDAKWRHAVGDFDYTLRAKAAGFPLLVPPGYMGVCELNTTTPSEVSSLTELWSEWKNLVSVKQLPVTMWWSYAMRHGGVFWPIVFVQPYLKFWLLNLARLVSQYR